MQYTKAFFIKLAMTIIVLWIILGLFYRVSFGNILLIGTLLSIVSFVGDVFILPKIGNFIASVSDLFLAFFVIWGLGTWVYGENTSMFAAAFVSALFIGLGEMFYHRYFKEHVIETIQEPEKNQGYTYTPRIAQTEFSQDFDEGLEKKENNDITKSETEGPIK
ncbi:YndM family protein [Lysinibacillus sp. SGAir0095]|uniref:YndM family protein n=1 Tax=Lysinibacillus sp. SGAir0095 TaxID=2070463 RepID=UPI0010CCE34C|nr:YndM family protein [Lysinibacillus sp. SGAir0095]QCR31246.1 hypothetical protein C1N55_03315 [Lysinibacillus sp. SGAir0095]